MRLIDTEEAFEMADEFPAFEEGLADKTDLKDLLNICDTIEAKPVVHAHWEKVNSKKGVEASAMCSNCKVYAGYWDATMEEFDFCPYCGAQMDGLISCAHEDDKPISQTHKNGVKISVISTEDVPKIMEEMEK